MSEPKIRIVPISELKTDPQNANKHTERGQGMVERSMSEHGFARPGLAAQDGTILAGNLSVGEVAPSLGMDEVILIETDGSRPIVHVRTDIESGSDEARMLAIEDNRTASVSLDWDADEMLKAARELDLSELFTDGELDQIIATAGGAIPSDDHPMEDDAATDQESAERDDSERWPLAIVLDLQERRRWEAYKKTLGIQTDKTVFLKLLEAAGA